MRYTTYFSIGCLFLLGACASGTVKDTLGLGNKAPDEFRVVSRPPLSLPPQFDLRPPAAPGETLAAPAHKEAESLLMGKPQTGKADNVFVLKSKTEAAVTPAEIKSAKKLTPELNLLERAGADNSNPNIRQALEQDRIVVQPEEEESWWDTFSILPPKKDPLVNAEGEAERLKQNKAEGKPANEGETPEVKQKDTGMLGKILDY